MTVTLTAPVAYDRSGAPIDLDRYSRLHQDLDYRILGRQDVAGLCVVTAWLGVDQGPDPTHGNDTEGPLIYGTAILDPGTGGLWDGYERFAATEDAARRNHETALNLAATRRIGNRPR